MARPHEGTGPKCLLHSAQGMLNTCSVQARWLCLMQCMCVTLPALGRVNSQQLGRAQLHLVHPDMLINLQVTPGLVRSHEWQV